MESPGRALERERRRARYADRQQVLGRPPAQRREHDASAPWGQPLT